MHITSDELPTVRQRLDGSRILIHDVDLLEGEPFRLWEANSEEMVQEEEGGKGLLPQARRSM
jgi:hypothetical protein